jgi:hypothetical protein
MSSAIPPATTNFEVPKDERPAARAKGTVKPSESPMTLANISIFRLTQCNRDNYLHITNDIRIDERAVIVAFQVFAADTVQTIVSVTPRR